MARRALAGLLSMVLALTGCSDRGKDDADRQAEPQPARPTDLADLLEAHTAALSKTGPYRDPDPQERQRAQEAVGLLLDRPDALAEHDRVFGALGFSARHGVDPVSGRPYSLFSMSPADAPAWGALLVDRSAGASLLVEVPHPGFDRNTDRLGLAVHRRIPGSVLLVAGAHRQAGDGAADVAHNDRSMFHALATAFAGRGLAQVQLHGFADANLPGEQVVVSTGAGPVNPLVQALAQGLTDAGFATCRAWVQRCGRLEGTRNEQGRAAAETGAVFVHLELGWDVRRDERSRDTVADTLAAAVG